MIYAGSDVKFRITSTQHGFSFGENKFEVTIKNKWGQKQFFVPKEDFFFDTEGNCYFTLENVKRGTYNAFFAGSFEDDDYDKQERVFTDEQEIMKVGICDCKPSVSSCQCEHKVQYEQVYTVSVDGEDYLADCDGKYIYTSDGKRIKFINSTTDKVKNMAKVELNMTGDEFKQLIEGNNPNGEVDTIPEMKKVLEGISDDTTVKAETQQQIDENIEEDQAEHSDIDEIF